MKEIQSIFLHSSKVTAITWPMNTREFKFLFHLFFLFPPHNLPYLITLEECYPEHPKTALTDSSVIDKASFHLTSNQYRQDGTDVSSNTFLKLNVRVQGQKTLAQLCHSAIMRLPSEGLEKKLSFSGKLPVFQQKP